MSDRQTHKRHSTRDGRGSRTARGEPRRQHISFPVIREVHGRLSAALLDGGDLAAAAKTAERDLRAELDRARGGHRKHHTGTPAPSSVSGGA